ncbi:leukocyte elastase inhibitor isoform X2 [Anabrus simplex]
MAWLASNGTTARQMESALNLIRDGQQFFILGFKNLFADFRNTTTVTVDIANRLFLQSNKNFHVRGTFQEAMREGFQSEVKEVDFATQLSEARSIINEWVQENTHGEITDLLSEGTVSETTQLVGVNALYFKGSWAKPFDEQQTTMEPFHVTPNTTVTVPMMHKKEYVMYANNPDLGYQAIIMRYRGMVDDPTGDDQTTSMLILLPYEGESLSCVESFVAAGNLSQLIANMAFCEVNISLPRFKIEGSLNLISALNKLGITDLFKEEADLSAMTNRTVFLNNVFQKTVVEVTEKGIEEEASAATSTDPVPIKGSPPEFKADRPFTFVIRDSFYHVNLVIGRVVQPN